MDRAAVTKVHQKMFAARLDAGDLDAGKMLRFELAVSHLSAVDRGALHRGAEGGCRAVDRVAFGHPIASVPSVLVVLSLAAFGMIV